MIVRELIEMLEEMDEESEVRIAFQPTYPLQYRPDRNIYPVTIDGKEVVYIAEGKSEGYLPKEAAEEIGW